MRVGGGSGLTLAAPFPEHPVDPVDPVDPLDPAMSSQNGVFIERVVTFDTGGHSRVMFF